ncbi:adenosylcobinamide-GDP ribazoletransferase, partial [Cutibacterium acnes]
AGVLGAHVTSRWAPLWIIHALPYVGDADGSKSKPLADALDAGALWVGTGWWLAAIGVTLALQPSWRWLGPVLAALLALALMRRWLARRLQGFTGDTLDATQQVTELAFYLGLAVALGVSVPVGG